MTHDRIEALSSIASPTEILRLLPSAHSIEESEALELAAKRYFEDAASGPLSSDKAIEFISFFKQVGFIRKEKPYGPKHSAPFGYSIFDLHDGMGFSVQLHELLKVEAFHVLRAQTESFVLACSLQDWLEEGDKFLASWAGGSATDNRIAHPTAAGDVIVIDDLNTVHTVVGCLLEEFATTSNDAVKRLHDQNQGLRGQVLPDERRDLSDALRSLGQIRPRRFLDPKANWEERAISEGSQTVIVDDLQRGLLGEHRVLDSEPFIEHVRGGEVVTIACLQRLVTINALGRRWELRTGETTAIPSAVQFRLSAAKTPATVALTSVNASTAFADLR